MPKVQLKVRRCKPSGAGNKTAKTPTSPCKAGRRRRPSTASSGPLDDSGCQPRVSGQGEVRVTVPNDADPLRDGPIDRRLTWKEPTQLVLTQPTSLPRDQATWDDVCVATIFGMGQLQGDVRTSESPRFTCEEAVHNWRSLRNMTLHTGEDIIQLESDELLNQSGTQETQVSCRGGHTAPTATRSVARMLGCPQTSLGPHGLPHRSGSTDPECP